MKTTIALHLGVAISLSALIVMNGCGGGDDPVVVPPAVVATVVSGTAAKGIVRQANVLVCRIVSGAPEPDASCAVGVTGADGAFAVPLNDGFAGPALVKITTSVASTMLDETMGADVRYDMTMRAMVPAVSAATVTYVTPFSEMAASLAGFANTNIDAFAITLANGQVQTLLSNLTGVDLSVKPVIDLKNNGSDPVMLGKQANMVKQLARLTMTAKRAPDTFDTSGGVHCNTPGTSVSQQLACATDVMSRAMARGANAAAFALSRIIPAIVAENPTSVAMAIIKIDGSLVTEWADMNSLLSMQAAMLRAGMPQSVVANTVQTMMLQMR